MVMIHVCTTTKIAEGVEEMGWMETSVNGTDDVEMVYASIASIFSWERLPRMDFNETTPSISPS